MNITAYSWAEVARSPGHSDLRPDVDERGTNVMTAGPSATIIGSAPEPFRGHQSLVQTAADNDVTKEKAVLIEPTLTIPSSLNAENVHDGIRTLEATIQTLSIDVGRRSSDLIQAETELASKDLEISDLQAKATTLREHLAAATARMADRSDKDDIIRQLKDQISELRVSLQSGTISLAQLYGPDSVQTWNAIVSKETGMGGLDPLCLSNKRLLRGAESTPGAQRSTTTLRVGRSPKGDPVARRATRSSVQEERSAEQVSAESMLAVEAGSSTKPSQDSQAQLVRRPIVRLPPSTPNLYPPPAAAGLDPTPGVRSGVPSKNKPHSREDGGNERNGSKGRAGPIPLHGPGGSRSPPLKGKAIGRLNKRGKKQGVAAGEPQPYTARGS
ncbi:uncharacterized protein GGS22DRAFT_190443 [Annulohypoxylon maeteangense]|uniref:uncharacterized protein n=1 Tax=Annulohypoxylon maeteangense TaxID=1927788 RepID=UPI0020074CFD|nr:uncharacterized protein GGS22DRAFT_190443 [Annulohypoxylon maeteangense]KAI0883135.1 hypothetical protein GGS22DRAFT_190443 [Annulohypoxylon maeteangense]